MDSLRCALRRPRCLAHDQVERAGSNLTKAAIAIQRHRYADGGIVTGKVKAAFHQTIVDFIYMERLACFPQQHRRRLWNCAVNESIVRDFDAGSD